MNDRRGVSDQRQYAPSPQPRSPCHWAGDLFWHLHRQSKRALIFFARSCPLAEREKAIDDLVGTATIGTAFLVKLDDLPPLVQGKRRKTRERACHALFLIVWDFYLCRVQALLLNQRSYKDARSRWAFSRSAPLRCASVRSA